MSRGASNVLPVCNLQSRKAAGPRVAPVSCRSRREEALLSEVRMRLVTSSPTPQQTDITFRGPFVCRAPDCRLQTGRTLRCATP